MDSSSTGNQNNFSPKSIDNLNKITDSKFLILPASFKYLHLKVMVNLLGWVNLMFSYF